MDKTGGGTANRRAAQISCCVRRRTLIKPNVSIADPFGLLLKSPATAAANRQLNYTGMSQLRGDEHHLLETWHFEAPSWGRRIGDVTQWWIARDNLLPAEIAHFGNGYVMRTRFLYDSINQPLSAEVFAAPKLEGFTAGPPEPLEGYTRRYVNLRDGSDNRHECPLGQERTKRRLEQRPELKKTKSRLFNQPNQVSANNAETGTSKPCSKRELARSPACQRPMSR